MPLREVGRVALRLLHALETLHRHGVVHRDVKPSNVLFDAAGQARLGDLGAAHLGDLGATVTGGLVGSLPYMAPEQMTGAPVSASTDLYALGCVIFEMLTGQAPFDQRLAREVERIELDASRRDALYRWASSTSSDLQTITDIEDDNGPTLVAYAVALDATAILPADSLDGVERGRVLAALSEVGFDGVSAGARPVRAHGLVRGGGAGEGAGFVSGARSVR
jgi:serine/threonine protein kinase